MDPDRLTLGQEELVRTMQGFNLMWRGVCCDGVNLVATERDVGSGGEGWEIEGREDTGLWMEDDHGIYLASESDYRIFLAALKYMAEEFKGWREA